LCKAAVYVPGPSITVRCNALIHNVWSFPSSNQLFNGINEIRIRNTSSACHSSSSFCCSSSSPSCRSCVCFGLGEAALVDDRGVYRRLDRHGGPEMTRDRSAWDRLRRSTANHQDPGAVALRFGSERRDAFVSPLLFVRATRRSTRIRIR